MDKLIKILFGDAGFAYFIILTVPLVMTAMFADFLIGEGGHRKIKERLLSLYIALDSNPSYQEIFKSIFSSVYLFLRSMSRPHLSVAARLRWLFLISLCVNLLFAGYVYHLLNEQTSGLLSNPNGTQQSYVPDHILLALTLLPIIAQSVVDAASLLITYTIALEILKTGRFFVLILLDLIMSGVLWVINAAFIVWITQNVSLIAWRCFGITHNSLFDFYEFNSCDARGVERAPDTFLNIIRSVLTLDFSFIWFEAEDNYPVSHTGLALMSLTTAWPTIIYLLLIVSALVAIIFGRWFRPATMVIVNRLDEQKEGILTKIAYAVSAIIGFGFIAVKLLNYPA